MTVLLFVKSQRIAVATTRPSYTLKREEAEARERLKREGIKFETIDLSKGFRHRAKAGFKGITVTPTLLDAHSPGKWYIGTKAISEYIEETRAAARRSPIHWTTRSRWV